jgi:hypothetical protein
MTVKKFRRWQIGIILESCLGGGVFSSRSEINYFLIIFIPFHNHTLAGGDLSILCPYNQTDTRARFPLIDKVKWKYKWILRTKWGTHSYKYPVTLFFFNVAVNDKCKSLPRKLHFFAHKFTWLTNWLTLTSFALISFLNVSKSHDILTGVWQHLQCLMLKFFFVQFGLLF